MLGVIFLACPGRLQLNTEALSQRRNELPMKCLDSNTGEEIGSDRFTVGIKRVFLREKDRNNDPIIEGVSFDGSDWPPRK